MFDRIEPAEAQRRVQAGAALIDVREIAEFEQARVPGAVLIPLSEFAQRYTELPQGNEVVLMCARVLPRVRDSSMHRRGVDRVRWCACRKCGRVRCRLSQTTGCRARS